ncbi:MAG: hypothetical protein ACLQSR_04170 [Limisphaerales bacterium]
MPININLLAEAQAAEELRRRDPVKRAVFFGISLAAVFLVFYAAVEAKAMSAKETEEGVEAEMNAQTNAYAKVDAAQKSLNLTRSKVEALLKLQNQRFLQGNLMNALQMATVNGVQLTGLALDQSYSLQGGDSSSGRPATVTGRIVLRLDARDYSPNPGDQINNFMGVIAKQAYFQQMLNKTNAIELTSPPSAPQEDNNGKNYVTFSLECQFHDKTQ